MSFKIVDWVMDHSQAEGSARLVALVLAENADQDTAECFPSMMTIARRARVSERTARSALRELEQLGELETRLHEGRGLRADRRTNLYVLVAFLRSRGAKSAGRGARTGGESLPDGGQSTTGTGGNGLPDNQGIEPSNEPLNGKDGSQYRKTGDSMADAQTAQRRLMDEIQIRDREIRDFEAAAPPESLLGILRTHR